MTTTYGEGLYGVGLYASPPPTLGDWQISHRGLLIGDGTPYDLTSIEGLDDLDGVRTSDSLRQRRHGSHPGDDLLGTRSVTIGLDLYAPASMDDTIGALKAAFTLGPEAPLFFQIPGTAGGGPRSFDARTRRLVIPKDLSYLRGIPHATLLVEATDPRIYDGTTYTEVAGLPSQPSGLSWPLMWPLSWGGVSTGGRASLLNEGNFPTEVFLRIDGPVTNPRVTNTTTGQQTELSIDLAVGEWLEIDARSRTVLLNGTASRYSARTKSSQWIELLPGLNEVAFDAFAGSSSARMSMTFRSAWI